MSFFDNPVAKPSTAIGRVHRLICRIFLNMSHPKARIKNQSKGEYSGTGHTHLTAPDIDQFRLYRKQAYGYIYILETRREYCE
jgi:hypothetical protein